MSRFNPCQVLAPLALVSADRQCLQGISAVKVPSDTENGLFDRMAVMLYPRVCAVPLLSCQCLPCHGCQAMAHTVKPVQRAAACAN